MIIQILALVCAVISPSVGKMGLNKFTSNFEDMCFRNEETDPFRVNGQDTPLSNTIENFISLAEKFEAANPSFDLKEELVYFLTEYLFENIKFINGRVDVWKIGRAHLEAIDALWDPERENVYKPTVTDPFTADEKCNLYYMISHSLLKDEQLMSRSYSPVKGNFSFNSNRANTDEIDPEGYYPQELGVVAIRGTDAAVSMSKVLLGLYVGLIENRKSDLTSHIQNMEIPDDRLPTDKTVDALYAVTLAEILMQSKWTGSDRRGLAPNGKWVSIPLSMDKQISGFCPMVYTHQMPNNGKLPANSYSSVRGAADGLILGLTVLPVYQKKHGARLSQILRMYYSPDGIPLETPIEGTNEKRVSFCNRQNIISSVENRLHDQMLSYGYLIAESWKDVEGVISDAESTYNKEKGLIYGNTNSEIRDYCDRTYSTEKPEDLPRETLLDIVVVMDSSNSENSFQEQQLIVGYLAKQLDLRYTGSRMTILLDQKNPSGIGASSKIELVSIVNDTYSSSCAACIVGQIPYEPSTMERDEVLVAIDHFLQERKENETKFNGVNGKVVIYFNYASDDGRSDNNKIQGRLEKALRDLHLNHLDVLFYAVGLDPELLKKYAKGDPSLVFLGTDGTHETVAKKIFQKISFAPSLLQYADCSEAKSENAANYENFVSPYTIQHYQMPAEYFYKSRSIKITFESNNGYITVCHNRATMRPENEIKFCKNTTGNNNIEFKVSNPCKSFTKESCAPFYFSIMGTTANSDMRQDPRPRDYCNDINGQWCATLDQIKYKVQHDGIRCSGCLGLGAPPAVILFTVLLIYFVYKRF